ncbi:unnamed protein product, partial [Allacma fusca]
MISWTLAVFLLFLSLLKIVQKKLAASVSDSSKATPGPWKLPLLGHLPFLGFFPHETMLKWKEKYGPIIFLQLGSYPAVVINDGALIKAAFVLKVQPFRLYWLSLYFFPNWLIENAVRISLLELLAAGVDTNSSTLEWLIYYLVKYPQVQEKAVEEIHAALGTNTFPRYSDRVNLPYCEALLLETLRKTTIVPLSLPHNALEDTEFQGFLIKKDTLVLGNLYAAHNDPKIWADAGSFHPERFLDDNGKLNKMEAIVMSFSTGKRKCIGENLARNQLFLFAVSILQNYRLQATSQLPSERGVLGITLACESFQ